MARKFIKGNIKNIFLGSVFIIPLFFLGCIESTAIQHTRTPKTSSFNDFIQSFYKLDFADAYQNISDTAYYVNAYVKYVEHDRDSLVENWTGISQPFWQVTPLYIYSIEDKYITVVLHSYDIVINTMKSIEIICYNKKGKMLDKKFFPIENSCGGLYDYLAPYRNEGILYSNGRNFAYLWYEFVEDGKAAQCTKEFYTMDKKGKIQKKQSNKVTVSVPYKFDYESNFLFN